VQNVIPSAEGATDATAWLAHVARSPDASTVAQSSDEKQLTIAPETSLRSFGRNAAQLLVQLSVQVCVSRVWSHEFSREHMDEQRPPLLLPPPEDDEVPPSPLLELLELQAHAKAAIMTEAGNQRATKRMTNPSSIGTEDGILHLSSSGRRGRRVLSYDGAVAPRRRPIDRLVTAARFRHAADPRRALTRVGISLAFGFATYLAVDARLPAALAALLAWDVAGLVLLGLAWTLIARADANVTRERAGSEDPGRTFVYVLVVLTSAASLLAATLLSRSSHTLAPRLSAMVAALCLTTVALAWTMTHTAFTFRYAHLYYREDAEGVGGVTLPGDAPPAYFDFAYVAFTIGMCFQVSDVCVTSHQIRRTVLLHAVISFAYNSVILAFVLNLVFGLAA
jgi:uncharacterized membrane protein